MKKFRLIIVTCLLFAACPAQGNDFPQWRGPKGAGLIKNSVPLAESWTSKGPAMAWESETFPQKCGYGSPVIAGGALWRGIPPGLDSTTGRPLNRTEA